MRIVRPIPEQERFEALTSPHLTDLFQSAFALLGDRKQAEAVVRQTCSRACECLRELSAMPAGRSWIFGLLLDEVRARRGKMLCRIRSHRAIGGGDYDMLPALRQLAPEHGEVIVLVDIARFSYRDVADALGIPLSSMIERLVLARQRFRAALEPALRPCSPQPDQSVAPLLTSSTREFESRTDAAGIGQSSGAGEATA